MSNVLNTGIKNARNVMRYIYGVGTLDSLDDVLQERRNNTSDYAIYFIDSYFYGNNQLVEKLCINHFDFVVYVDTTVEPTTEYINSIRDDLAKQNKDKPVAIVGIGGGATLDTTKAISNLLNNPGYAEDYQGWDLVKSPGVYKIAIPTISGTGAEATRTCVMTNKKTGLKLGMNSDYTVFDQIILDPDLTKTVPRNQYFYTGMDAYVHCIESISGAYRNAVGDAFSDQTIKLCREIFFSEDMMDEDNRAKLMVASYLGGCAIATSYVGVVHPFSAGLSVVLGLHHCVANCITMRAMDQFYPDECQEFWQMVERQGVEIPKGVCKNLTNEQYDQLYASTVIHEKPLTNALGEGFKDILTRENVKEIFQRM